MNGKRVELTEEKIADEEPVAVKDEQASGKRGRDVDNEFRETDSPLKIRKTLPETDARVKKKCDVLSNDSAISETNFNIGDDSALLADLLSDFSEDFETPSSCASSLKENNCPASTNSQNEEKPSEEEKPAEMNTTALQESEFDEEFDDFFDEPFQEDNKNSLNLEEFCYCIVADIERKKKFTEISLKDLQKEATAIVQCYDYWRDVNVEKGEVVSIKAKKESDHWLINYGHGFIVTKPYNLITGTEIVGAKFCLRRGVLTNSFRGIDALPNMESDSTIMTIGSLVHELLQLTLKRKVCLEADIAHILGEVISTRRAVQMCYDSNISLRECKAQLTSFIPKIFSFVNRYILGNTPREIDNNFKGKIERVREIEETVWMPPLGIRGKMDVTIDVTMNLQRKIMPIELKTGRASFSAEHRGQVVLYNMMLRYAGQNVDTGLLLYLREGIMNEVKSSHNEERDLIMLRNSYAEYITQGMQFEEVTKEDGKVEKVWKHMKLPEPVNHPYACDQCAFNTLCSVYAEKDSELELPDSHAVRKIHKGAITYLTPEHIDYVMKWITMVKLEDSSKLEVTTNGDLWTMPPRAREEKGIGLCNLKVCEKVVEANNKYLHTFGRKDSNEEYALTDLTKSDFTDGEYIIVSTDKRVNVSAGHLQNKTKNTVQLLLDRNIVRQNPNATFHLDKYPYTSFPTLSLANVACLLSNNNITNKLREIVIDKKPATFVQKLPKSVAQIGADILYRLNKYQRQAVLKVLTAEDYMLIKGMPGTGKTQTLVALIDLLVKTGRSVLVTAHTHSAVDNILLKLDERGIDFMRLAASRRINPAILHKSEEVLTAQCKTPESLAAVYATKKVVGVTCLGASHGLLLKRIFDVCIVDEAGQVMQSVVLRPLYSASKFILVGDPEQLPPVIRSREARKLGMNESLFDRLDSEHNTVTLKLQYRMNRKIMSLPNEMTYEGNMKAANEEVSAATLQIKDTMVLESCERWVSKALSTNLEDAVVVLNTGATSSLISKYDVEKLYNKEDQRFCNVFEAAIILRLVAVLLKGGVATKSIGIICPFVSQVQFVRTVCPDIEINTVDQYQGRDKEIVVYSCTRSMRRASYEPTEFDILQDRNRLNVAVTRAKHKLIIIGDKMCLDNFTPFANLFRVLKDDIIDLEPGRDDFSWDILVQLLK